MGVGLSSGDATCTTRRVSALGLATSPTKLDAGERLTFDDGVRLFECPDLLALGWLANREREKRHGGAHLLQLQHPARGDQRLRRELPVLLVRAAAARRSRVVHDVARAGVGQAARSAPHQPLTEVHVVNGLHPDLPFDYYLDMLRGFKRIRPGHPSEVLHRRRDRVLRGSLRHDRRAGAARAAGRRGSIRCPAAARRSSPSACAGRSATTSAAPIDISTIHRLAHRLGMRTNVTMLYGHIETSEERVDHMLRARALQDETGGFQAFIPLAFHPDNNQMRKLPAPSATDTLRVHAVSRLMLDNIPHIKAFWIATGVEMAQIALWFGVDDLDGTVQEEKIYHMAGARTPEAMTTSAIRRLIRAAGREPVERDTLYNVVTGPEAPDEAPALVQSM